MRIRTSGLLGTIAVTALVLAGCGGAAATQAPGATAGGPGATTGPVATTTGGEATEQPAATENPTATQGTGGDGSHPAGWDQYGKVHVDMSGPATKSADYGFVPAGSLFGGAQGSSLNFAIDGTDEVVSILIGADGSVIVSYGGPDFSMPGANCTTTNWNIGTTSASGSFDCTAAITIMGSGASLAGGKIKGSFTAHA